MYSTDKHPDAAPQTAGPCPVFLWGPRTPHREDREGRSAGPAQPAFSTITRKTCHFTFPSPPLLRKRGASVPTVATPGRRGGFPFPGSPGFQWRRGLVTLSVFHPAKTGMACSVHRE